MDMALGATKMISSSPSSHALIACIALKPGASNHMISDYVNEYQGSTPILETLSSSALTGIPLHIISFNGFISNWDSENSIYCFVIEKSWTKVGPFMETMGTSC